MMVVSHTYDLFIRFYRGDTLIEEPTRDQQVTTTDIKTVFRDIQLPKDTAGVRIFRRLRATLFDAETGVTEEAKCDPRPVTKLCFPYATSYRVSELSDRFPMSHFTMINSIKSAGYERAVKLRTGGLHPFDMDEHEIVNLG